MFFDESKNRFLNTRFKLAPCWTPPADNQRWTLTWLPAQPDTVTIVDKASGQCLDQDYTSGTPHPGVLAFPCSNAANRS